MAADSLRSLTEQELAARFRASGEGRWFAELYRRQRRGIYALCLRFLGEPQAAEDACHEAFVRAFENFERFDGEHFSAWLRRIAANVSIDHLRARQATTPTPPPDVAAPEPSPERQLGGRVALAAALEVVRSLGPEQRRAFVMFHIEGLSYQEIAERTCQTLDAVRSQLQNARRNFHQRWARTPFEPEAAIHE